MNPTSIIDYWYSDNIQPYWFSSTPELDAKIKADYETLWQCAKNGELKSWKTSPEGCLALAIILDQFPLNMFRGTQKSFATEAQAIDVSLHAIEQHYDEKIDRKRLSFLIMPLMHSESIKHQNLSVALFKKHKLTDNLHFAEHHRDIVKKFGRFPHRNAILNRPSTKQEIAYLESENAFRG